MGEILDLPKNTATEYLVTHFLNTSPGFSFILQIITVSEGIKIMQTRNANFYCIYYNFWIIYGSSKTREGSTTSGPQLNIIVSLRNNNCSRNGNVRTLIWWLWACICPRKSKRHVVDQKDKRQNGSFSVF